MRNIRKRRDYCYLVKLTCYVNSKISFIGTVTYTVHTPVCELTYPGAEKEILKHFDTSGHDFTTIDMTRVN